MALILHTKIMYVNIVHIAWKNMCAPRHATMNYTSASSHPTAFVSKDNLRILDKKVNEK